MTVRSRVILAAAVLFAAVAGVPGVVAVDDPGIDRPARAADSPASVAQSAACEFPVSETDATGTQVSVGAEPTRIVTLAPSAAQTVWEVGGQHKVVGVTGHAAYLEGAENRTNVSGAGQSWVNVETVVGLEPDLVLAPDVIDPETVETLRRAGLTVYHFREPESIDDVREQTLLTGRLIGECDGAEETVAWMNETLDTVREAVEGRERPRVLYTFFGYTAGEGTFIDHVITLAGGENVAASANVSGFQQISPEVVAQRNPEWIVLNEDSPTVPRSEAYNATDAVQNDRIVVVDRNYINQPAPRIVLTIDRLARTFHPEAYDRAANESAESEGDTVTSSQAPGLGAASSLAALLAVVALAAVGRR